MATHAFWRDMSGGLKGLMMYFCSLLRSEIIRGVETIWKVGVLENDKNE